MLEASVKRGDHALDSAAFVLLRADQLAAPPHVVVPAAGFESGHGTLAFRDAVVDLRAVLDEQCEEMLGLTAIRCRCVRGPIATPRESMHRDNVTDAWVSRRALALADCSRVRIRAGSARRRDLCADERMTARSCTLFQSS
ncbi:MAG: hypothetical protein QOH60_2571 [Mycobacterium sp.]|jgi:hypothetical protein|nr:hypothetical protein [Mycobacterium sp.]